MKRRRIMFEIFVVFGDDGEAYLPLSYFADGGKLFGTGYWIRMSHTSFGFVTNEEVRQMTRDGEFDFGPTYLFVNETRRLCAILKRHKCCLHQGVNFVYATLTEAPGC